MTRFLQGIVVLLVLCGVSTAQAREYGTYVFINTCDDLEEFLPVSYTHLTLPTKA